MFLMYYLEKVAYVQCIFAEILNILWLVMSPSDEIDNLSDLVAVIGS